VAKHKGCKDKKPRLRRSAPVRIIEKRMKDAAPDKTELSDEKLYLNYRNKLLRHLFKVARPVEINAYISSHVKRMIDEGTVERIGNFFRITDKGKREVRELMKC